MEKLTASDEKMVNPEFESRILKMKSILKITSIPSSQVIYIQLYIYGKMTYNDLMDKLNYSRATIFTGLKVLQEANMVEKHEDPTVQDKRKNIFYTATQISLEINIDQSFLNYLLEHQLIETYLQYVQLSHSLSLSITKVALEISQAKTVDKMQEYIHKNNSMSDTHEYRGTERSGVIYNEINSMKDTKKLKEMLHECIQEFELKTRRDNRDLVKPLEDPVAFSIIFIGLD